MKNVFGLLAVMAFMYLVLFAEAMNGELPMTRFGDVITFHVAPRIMVS